MKTTYENHVAMEGLEPPHTYEPRTYKQLCQFAYRAIKWRSKHGPLTSPSLMNYSILKYCTIMCI